jgi:hypothetical protein
LIALGEDNQVFLLTTEAVLAHIWDLVQNTIEINGPGVLKVQQTDPEIGHIKVFLELLCFLCSDNIDIIFQSILTQIKYIAPRLLI